MIDYVHLALTVSIRANTLKQLMWKEQTTPDGEPYYYHGLRGVKIYYFPVRTQMIIKGKILMLLHDTQVQNVDDIYGADTERFITDINAYLNRLLTRPLLDVRAFEVKRIDYCFNVHTPYVDEYLDLLSVAFQRRNNGSRVDFAWEHNAWGSVYIKTLSDYQKNTRRNYVLNFYSKLDRLYYLLSKGEMVSSKDIDLAMNVLRLEVQCGFQFLKALKKKLHIGNTFGELFSFAVAYHAEQMIYKLIFDSDGTEAFYTYDAAKKLLPEKAAAARNALKIATRHSITDKKYAHARKRIKAAGIYPHCFIAKKTDIDRLDNPLILIAHKLEGLGVLP